MRVLICDDHRLFAESLAMVTRVDGHDVVVLDDPRAAPRAVRAHASEVCVMDLHYPSADGIEAVAAVCDAHPDVRVVVLSGHLDEEVIAAVTEAGAVAWAEKGGSLDEVLRLMTGGTSDPVRASSDHWQGDEIARFLTQREREVLEALTEGATTVALARRFSVSPATVSTHVQSILAKLGVHSRLEAVAFAVSHGLVDTSLR